MTFHNHADLGGPSLEPCGSRTKSSAAASSCAAASTVAGRARNAAVMTVSVSTSQSKFLTVATATQAATSLALVQHLDGCDFINGSD